MFDPGAVVSIHLLLIHSVSHLKDSNCKAAVGCLSVQCIVKLFPFGGSFFVALNRKKCLYVRIYIISELNAFICKEKDIL